MKLIDKLQALVKASKMLNLELHGREDCKSCTLQENLEVIIAEEQLKDIKKGLR